MKTKELTLSAIVLALIIVLGFVPSVPLGFIPVPIALQSMGIMLAGIILGRRYGFYTVMVFLLLGLVGMPIIRGNGGVAFFMGPTVGYLIGYALAALTIGWGVHYLQQRDQFNIGTATLVLFCLGVLVINVSGAWGLHVVTNMPLGQALFAQLAFLPGDAMKAFIAAVVGVTLYQRRLTL
jgi:biotin transport system substrate-specific component